MHVNVNVNVNNVQAVNFSWSHNCGCSAAMPHGACIRSLEDAGVALKQLLLADKPPHAPAGTHMGSASLAPSTCKCAHPMWGAVHAADALLHTTRCMPAGAESASVYGWKLGTIIQHNASERRMHAGSGLDGDDSDQMAMTAPGMHGAVQSGGGCDKGVVAGGWSGVWNGDARRESEGGGGVCASQ